MNPERECIEVVELEPTTVQSQKCGCHCHRDASVDGEYLINRWIEKSQRQTAKQFMVLLHELVNSLKKWR